MVYRGTTFELIANIYLHSKVTVEYQGLLAVYHSTVPYHTIDYLIFICFNNFILNTNDFNVIKELI